MCRFPPRLTIRRLKFFIFVRIKLNILCSLGKENFKEIRAKIFISPKSILIRDNPPESLNFFFSFYENQSREIEIIILPLLLNKSKRNEARKIGKGGKPGNICMRFNKTSRENKSVLRNSLRFVWLTGRKEKKPRRRNAVRRRFAIRGRKLNYVKVSYFIIGREFRLYGFMKSRFGRFLD